MCLDFSGSMGGKGEDQLKAALSALLTPAQTARGLIQWTPADRIIVIPFDSEPRTVVQGDGSPASQAQLLQTVLQQHADGGTDMYACAERAFAEMKPYLDKGGYLPAVVLMTDGQSEGGDQFEAAWRTSGREIPVFGVTFGDANKSQLDHVAEITRARVFDGGADLTEAFRSARGYN